MVLKSQDRMSGALSAEAPKNASAGSFTSRSVSVSKETGRCSWNEIASSALKHALPRFAVRYRAGRVSLTRCPASGPKRALE